MLLMHQKLWTYATGEAYGVEKKPDPGKEMKALSLIWLHGELLRYLYVRSAKTAKDAWSELSKVFEDKGLERHIGLIDNLLD
ncbi:hypothetical protein PR048_026507 [Dryococelus australis]|uniref:Uncharacterized protein n=1 Tax=Dryococelus australis TaxID=614101 RepID=A0ABQ9GLI6_9NEOP|nr:hypothetical protein PR048_026507 [Dryococelus australis]